MLNFKELRKKKNLTQKEFAELIGISLRALSNYENGNIDITLKKVQEIADILEVDFYDLFERNEQETNKPSTNIATNVETATNIATNVETATKREIHLSEEVIALLKEKISHLEKQLESKEKENKENISMLEMIKEIHHVTLRNAIQDAIKEAESELKNDKEIV